MYKIGEFSKITSLTTKALRYYDEQGLLVPSSRDTNEYRLYNDADYRRAQMIVLLRNLDFSIAEIKDVLEHVEQTEDLSYYLAEKKVFIEHRIRSEKELIKKLESHLLPIKKEVKKMNYQINEKVVEPVAVASIRYQGKYSDVGKYIGTIYKVVKDKANGEPFHLYYDDEFKENADIELCVPTKGLLKETDSGVTCKMLPKINGISTVHIGSYETINLAYKAVFDYAKEKGISCTLPSREIYHKGPGMIFKGNSDKYETEIIIPIETKE